MSTDLRGRISSAIQRCLRESPHGSVRAVVLDPGDWTAAWREMRRVRVRGELLGFPVRPGKRSRVYNNRGVGYIIRQPASPSRRTL